MPHFFIYAKDKTLDQVEDNNGTLVNKLENIIINPRISIRKLKLGKLDYKLLMNNPDIDFDVCFHSNRRLKEEGTHSVVVEFMKLNSIYRHKLNIEKYHNLRGDLLRKSQLRQNILYSRAVDSVKAKMSELGYSDYVIADILVKYLYNIRPDKHKTLLWVCYGKEIYNNIISKMRMNLKSIKCCDCGNWFNVSKMDNSTCRCSMCKYEYRKKYMKEFMKEKRRKNVCR